MLPPFFSDFIRILSDKKSLSFLTFGFWGAQKIQSYDGLSIARIMPLYTQTVLHTANPPFAKYFFVLPRLAWHILV